MRSPFRPLTVLWAATAALGTAQEGAAYESAYPKTGVGIIEVKHLPAVRALSTMAQPGNGQGGNGMFMTLFRYIQANDIAMTVPVEEEPASRTMRFFVGSRDLRRHESSETVTVAEHPARTVVSIGLRGAYRDKLYKQAAEKLDAWLAKHPEYEPVDAPYRVFWNSPFMIPMFKRSELHVPVRPAPR